MIRVIKRDGCEEAFDASKLAVAMYRAMLSTRGSFHEAGQLASAVRIYLWRTGVKRISSEAVMTMALKVLRAVGLSAAAGAMKAHAEWRRWRRGQVRIRHDCRRLTLCEKGWLGELARRNWNISRRAGRIIAAVVERELLAGERDVLRREEIENLINQRVSEFGLADAVPVAPGARAT